MPPVLPSIYSSPALIKWTFSFRPNATLVIIHHVLQALVFVQYCFTPICLMLEYTDLQLANKLNNAVESLDRPPLPVYVQVNTSGEETKYGIEPSECTQLAQHIRDSCKHLKFAGLMTIGQPDYSSRPENFEVRPHPAWLLDRWRHAILH